MSSSRRIAVNVLSSYGRSIVSAGLALFSSRWVLNALGQDDYGLYNVVGALIAFIVFLNGVLSNSASRHFAFSIGRGDPREVRRWFNSALSIHVLIATVLIVAGWPLGEHVVRHSLTIPEARVATSVWVFRISLVSAFVGMVSVPFVAMFTAKQYIAELALWALVQSGLVFLLAFGLRFVSGDLLLIYALGMVSIVVAMQAARIIRGFALFEECRLSFSDWLSREHLKEIFGFAFWNSIGSAGQMLRDQGSNVLLNLHFGPGVNAAYGIANQLSGQTTVLSSSMIGAFSPEITASEGRGDRARMLSLSGKASKFGTLLVLLFAVPLMLEMEYVLRLWLRIPPDHAADFCRWILFAFMIERMSTGAGLAVNAHGKIAAYQSTVGLAVVAAFPLAWLFLAAGSAPTSIGIAFVLSTTAVTVGRLFWMRKLFGQPMREWIRRVALPTILTGAAATAAGALPLLAMPQSFARLCLATGISVATILCLVWSTILGAAERKVVAGRLPGPIRNLSYFRRISSSGTEAGGP